MFVYSVSDLPVVLVIVLVVVFGAAKLPKLGGDVGQAIKNFKQGLGKDQTADPVNSKQITDRADQPRT